MGRFRHSLTSLVLLVFGLTLVAPCCGHCQEMQITGLRDIALSSWQGGGAISGSDTVCVYKTKGNDRYAIRASGSGPGGTFRVSNGLGSIPYVLNWRELPNGGFVLLNPNVAVEFRRASKANSSCGGSDNAELLITISAASLATVLPGIYSGVLTLLVEPR